MSVSVAQHAPGTGSGTSPAVTLSSTTAGTLLVANVFWRTSGGNLTMPAGWLTDAGLKNADGPSLAQQWYYPNNPGGITGVTGSLDGSAVIWGMDAIEVQGLGASAGLDQRGKATTPAGTGSTVGASDALTTTAAPEYLCAAFAADDSVTAGEFGTPTGGFAVRDQARAGNSLAFAVLDQVAASTGTFTAGVTDSDGSAYLFSVFGTYAAAVAPAASPPPPPAILAAPFDGRLFDE